MPRLVLLVAVTFMACTCKTTASLVRALELPPRAAPSAPGALFEVDPEHPWNRVHRALFLREVSLSHSACLSTDGGCLLLTPAEIQRGEHVATRVLLGGDEPLAFIGEDVTFLGESPRFEQVLSAVAAAAAVKPGENPIGAVLLQNDVWERLDAIDDALAWSATQNKDRLAELRAALRGLMWALALPKATLAGIGSNEAELAAAFPDVLPDFATRAGWLEVRSEATTMPAQETFVHDTRHAERWGHRVSFRVFARVAQSAGGSEWLRKSLQPALRVPEGTRLIILGAPLVVAREGEVVPLPLVTLVESRVARAEGFVAATLAELGNDVLEGKRALLVAQPRPHAGFERMAADAAVPRGVTCLPDRFSRVPLRAACVMCHQEDGARLTGPMAHGQTRMTEEVDALAAGRAVARLKEASPGWKALRSARPPSARAAEASP